MARFYGWNDREIKSLSAKDFSQYWEAITVIEAREMLLDIEKGDFPNMKPETRRRRYKEIHKLAYPVSNDKTPAKTLADMARMMSGGVRG